jgi:hypothetical protein
LQQITFTNSDGGNKVGQTPAKWKDIVEENLKEGEVTTRKKRQRTECSEEASLGRSRLEQG